MIAFGWTHRGFTGDFPTLPYNVYSQEPSSLFYYMEGSNYANRTLIVS